jgi:hypothetical protein
MENNIDIKNKKLIIFSLILVLLICCLLVSNNKKRQTKKLKRKLDKIFRSDSFITVPSNTCGDYNLTYGELNWEGMENISKYMELKDWSKNTFIDLGSGNGRTLAYAILNGFKEAKGTELVQARHNYALKMRNKLDSYMKDKIKLSNKDLFKLDPSYFPPGSVVFISNLVFPKETTQKLINFLSENTPSDVIIILSSIPDNLGKFKLIEKLELSMSWSPNSTSYILSKI